MIGADRATTAAASIAYAAPESLVQGKPSDSTDQYCLAVSYVELKTGKLPYSDLTMAAVMEAKRRDDLDLSMLPEAVRVVVRRATSSDPAKRYGSCREMVRQLRAASGSETAGSRETCAALAAGLPRSQLRAARWLAEIRSAARGLVPSAAVAAGAVSMARRWRSQYPLIKPSSNADC